MRLVSSGRAPFFASAFHLRLPLLGPPPPRVHGEVLPDRPPGETWYAEPAKVADNLYFLGTRIHSAWAIVGNEGTIVLEALYDYAAQDEILGGMRKAGLDPRKVKYVILSHAHADHDGGARLLQDEIPGVHLVYGAADWEAVDKSYQPRGRQTQARHGWDRRHEDLRG